MAKFCMYCGSELKSESSFCPNCGSPVDGEKKSETTTVKVTNGDAKSRIAAGLLGIFLGGWGVHNFYLGYTDKGVIQIVVTFLTCGLGGLWGFIEGILILCGNINEDANGVPLTD